MLTVRVGEDPFVSTSEVVTNGTMIPFNSAAWYTTGIEVISRYA